MRYKMSRLLLSACLSLLFAVAAMAQGPMAQDFNATSLAGEEISLGDFKGKVVVLNFWSTRCVICNSELPKLNKLVSDFRGKDVVFLAVTVENPLKVEPYLKKNRFDFAILPNGFGVLLKYAEKDSEGIITMPYPSFYVVDQRGRIALKTIGAGKTAQMSAAIDRLLAGN